MHLQLIRGRRRFPGYPAAGLRPNGQVDGESVVRAGCRVGLEDAVGDEYVDLLPVGLVAQALDQRDPVHVLRPLELVGDLITTHSAETQLDAVSQQCLKLGAQGDARPGIHGQEAARRHGHHPGLQQDPGPGRCGRARSGERHAEVGELALELQHLREEDRPRPQFHPAGPVAARRRLDALAASDPRVEEGHGRTVPAEDADRHAIPCARRGRARAPHRGAQAAGREQGTTLVPLVGKERRRDLRTEVDVGPGQSGQRGQRMLELQRPQRQRHPVDQVGTIGRGDAGCVAGPAEDLALTAQALGLGQADEVELAAADRGCHRHSAGLLARAESGRGRGGLRRLRAGRRLGRLDEVGDLGADGVGQVEQPPLGVDSQAGAQ